MTLLIISSRENKWIFFPSANVLASCVNPFLDTTA
jgi:hypothetical protein